MEQWIERHHQATFGTLIKKGRILVLYGPRRVGKTSLVNSYLSGFTGKMFAGTGDDLPLRDLFREQSIASMRAMFSDYELLFIDEAQRLPDVGTGLKILADHLPDLAVIASGSSSFELSTHIGEPLTGRHLPLMLFPLSVLELRKQFGAMGVMERLNDLLVFGAYPETLTAPNEAARRTYLATLRDSYLFKDILALDNIRNSDKVVDLLRLIAFQVGREVSLSELSGKLGIAKMTVERYLDLLEKCFVIKRVRGFSRNLRKEVMKTARYYFLDNGIRNALINNFNPLSMRDDVGLLWENFLFIERHKRMRYQGIHADIYFWRTYDQKEIDLVEERDGTLCGFEFKWGSKTPKPPKLWTDTYPNATYTVIDKENFLDFVS